MNDMVVTIVAGADATAEPDETVALLSYSNVHMGLLTFAVVTGVIRNDMHCEPSGLEPLTSSD